MRTLKMFLVRWKSCVRQPYSWAFVALALLAALLPALSSRYEIQDTLPIGLVDEDGGELSLKLGKLVEGYDEMTVFPLDREKAMRWLAMGRLEGVFVVERGYTRRLRKGEWEELLTMYVSPASSAAVTLSETLMDCTMRIWTEETALLEMDKFMRSQGLAFTDEQRADMRETYNRLLTGGTIITIEEHVPDPPQAGGGEYGTLLKGTAWYAAYVALFMIAGAGWVIESRRRAMGERMRAAGIHPLSALLGSALAVTAVCMLGWLVLDAALCAILDKSFFASLRLALPMALYLAGIMGMTVSIASVLTRWVQLMLAAPVFTLAHGVLCGMLMPLPDWAATLVYVSYAFPGRWLTLAAGSLMSGGSPAWALGQAACALFWLALGAAAALAGSRAAAPAES